MRREYVTRITKAAKVYVTNSGRCTIAFCVIGFGYKNRTNYATELLIELQIVPQCNVLVAHLTPFSFAVILPLKAFPRPPHSHLLVN